MRFSNILKAEGFYRNRDTDKSVVFKGFWEGDFDPVFKNTEKRHESVLQPAMRFFQ
jgi:hypothetical protein